MAEDDPKRKKKSANPTERYLPPKQAITKGSPKRLKSSKEKAKKKDRLCCGCGKFGVAHDRRNCPGLDKRHHSIEFSLLMHFLNLIYIHMLLLICYACTYFSSIENNNEPFNENEALERSSEDEALTQ
eukprot:TRINITY_DN4604_c0_g2_i3.p1 TRINITY_DN4604_c0_g2~~TRINITY_DN4604_c0_g2_i3.p1  ORF type:complete len:128 (-),score=24.69 TRINITY_DN4604_c0_g2_i3:1504-1887(-)